MLFRLCQIVAAADNILRFVEKTKNFRDYFLTVLHSLLLLFQIRHGRNNFAPIVRFEHLPKAKGKEKQKR